tara:strand:- start:912 stop:1235 length:324 start_codon:yes stop_codon:yes gene_type:complete
MVAKGKSKRKPTAWSLHIKETMKANPGMLLKDVLKLAGKTYKKGADAVKTVVTNVGKTVKGVAKKTRKTLKKTVGGKKTKTQKRKTKTQKRKTKTQKRKTQKRKTKK